MLRLTTLITRALYHNKKIIRLDLTNKNIREVEEHRKEEHKKMPLTEYIKHREKKEEEQVSLRMLKRTLEQQENGPTKEEQAINHLIKVETKSIALFKLYKAKHFAFTPRNLVNLLMKVLQLRQINLKEQEPQKLEALLQTVCRKANKFSPEDMVRFLHSLKKVKILTSDFLLLSPLIRLILQDFAARTNQGGIKGENDFESFYVISLDTNIKLLHSLHHLHFLSGSYYEPIIVSLIRSSLFYFHRLVTKSGKEKLLHSSKAINWSFYISFVKLAGLYNMPVDVVTAFVKALNMQKRAYQGSYNYLYAIEDVIHNHPSLRTHCRGANIANYADIFHIHLFIYELIEKPNQLIKMRPLHLLIHVKSLTDFTEDEVNLLKYGNLRTTTLERLLKFTIKVYQKFFISNYSSEIEKANIEKWVQDGQQSLKEYLGQFLLIYRQLVAKKMVRNAVDLSLLINLCLQHFSSLTPHTQMVVLRITLEEQPQNCKPILDIFFGRGEKVGDVRKYKKSIQVDAYTKIFPYWKTIGSIANITVDTHSQGCFLRFFFAKIANADIQLCASQFADRIIANDQSLFSLLIKKYVRVSECNRSLGKTFSQRVLSPQFRRQLDSCNIVFANERQDRGKLNEFWQLKTMIRLNMKRGLISFKFLFLLMEAISQKSGGQDVNITSSTLFKELYFHFNEEIKCLHFRELFTIQIYSLANQIAELIRKKGALEQTSEIYKISQYEQCQKLKSPTNQSESPQSQSSS